MKNWNSSEQDMRQWKPRQPDDRIRKSLFQPRGFRFAPAARATNAFRSLAPATALLALGIVLYGTSPHSPVVSRSFLTEFREPQLFGTQKLQTVIDSSFFQRNSLPTPTLASTNSGRMISSVGPFSLYVTNTLNH